jgi:hypothetical protein
MPESREIPGLAETIKKTILANITKGTTGGGGVLKNPTTGGGGVLKKPKIGEVVY